MDLLSTQKQDNLPFSELSQLRRFFGLSLDMLAIADAKGSLQRVNPAMERALGYSEDELLATPILDIVHPEDRADIRLEFARLRRGKAITYCESRFLTRGGETVWIAWSCYPALEEGAYYAVGREITPQRSTQDRLRRQQQVLSELMNHPAIQDGDLPRALRVIAEMAARTMGVERVSAWRYSEDRTHITCQEFHERATGVHGSGDVLWARDYPAYFEALASDRVMVVSDAVQDPRTCELSEYFAAHGISSVMDVPIRVGGELRGILCHEHVGPARQWTVDEEAFAATLGDALALAYEARERRLAQEALRQKEERFRFVAMATTDVLYDWNIRTGEFWWNEGLRTLCPAASHMPAFGIEQWSSFVHPEDRDRIWASLRQALAGTDMFWGAEYRFRTDENESYATIRESGYILRDADGLALRMIGAMEDISERVKAEAERARAIARETAARVEIEAIKELNRLKNQFVNAVSHDLRVPLTSVMGYAEFLEDGIGGHLSPQQSVFVDQIQKNAIRLTHLVDDLLDFARMEAGTLKLNLEEGDLTARIREVVESLAPQIEAAGLTLSLELPEEPAMACIDGPRIERVLFNLLNNAMKFTPAQGRIRVRVASGPEGVRAEVHDTGAGIASEDLPKLFKPFSQLEGSERKGGTGLGLNIVKLLVEAHGGVVGVESTPGEGSCFWFTLPIRSCPPEESELLLED